jgi:hypothetical protein
MTRTSGIWGGFRWWEEKDAHLDDLSLPNSPSRLRLLMSQRMKLLTEDRVSAGTSTSARRVHAALEIRADGDLRTPPRGVKKTPSASVYLTRSRDAFRFSSPHFDAGGRRRSFCRSASD